ncbi:MAG: imidazoleglycerol-phosphate dehydratase [Rhodobacterales bacterium]|nr:MAG: imidazoleglycerol-phosphate dehydratase [Rhodobacterales bacterium]
MKKLIAAAVLAITGTVASADPVEGVWRSPTNDEGASITVNVVACDSGICGVIRSVSGGDASIVGKTMIWGMQPQGGGRYSGGKIWAPDQDKTYNGKLTMSGNSLKVEGCVLGICRGETFSR